MQPIEIPLSTKLDINDSVQKAKDLDAALAGAEKRMANLARAAKRYQDRMANATSSAQQTGTGGGSFTGGTPGQKKTPITADQGFFDKLGQTLLRMRPATIAGSLASGNVGGLGRMGAQSLLQALGEAGGMAGALGLGIGGVGLGLTGAYFGINKAQANFTRSQMLLSSAITGGPNLGNPAARGLQIASMGQVYSQSPKNMQALAQTLAQMGVNGRGGQLMGTLVNTAAFAGAHGMNPSDLSGLTGSLTTQGGMSQASLNRMFQDLGNVSKDSDVSVSQLLDSMKTLSKTATGAARDVLSLAAVQHIVGASSGINVGAVMNPVLSAQGGQSLAASALLGLSPDQFISMQSSRGGAAKIFDRISGLVKQMDQGPAGTSVTEALLQGTGLMDLSQLNPKQAKSLLDTMKRSGGDAAYKQYQQYSKQTSGQVTSEEKSLKTWSGAIDRNTDAMTKLSIWLENALTHAVNSPGQSGGTLQARSINGKGVVNQVLLGEIEQYGLGVKNQSGSVNEAKPDVIRAYAKASKATGVPLAVLLAQGSQESGFNIHAAGGGLGQFTPGTIKNLATNKADNKLVPGLNKFFSKFNPATASADQEAMAQAMYDQLLGKMNGGNWKKALNAYNSGSPSHGYGTDILKGQKSTVYQRAEEIQVQLNVNVKTDHTGNGKHTSSSKAAGKRVPKGHKNHT